MEELVTLSINAEDYDPLKSWQLVSWCKVRGADEWAVTTLTLGKSGAAWLERFDGMTKTFHLPAAKRRSLTTRRRGSRPSDFIRPAELWRLNFKSLAVLQQFLPDGLFTYQVGEDGWLEDPVFYRHGEFMLGVVTHEREGILRVTKAEHHLLEVEGFVFQSRGLYVGY